MAARSDESSVVLLAFHLADLLVSRTVGLMAYLSAVQLVRLMVGLTAYPSAGYLAFQLVEMKVCWSVAQMVSLLAVQ